MEETTLASLPEIPKSAFEIPLEQLELKEHVFNILMEAGIDTVGPDYVHEGAS